MMNRGIVVLALGWAALFGRPVQAVDGVILIDQNKALAGNVTPGDTPGFPVWITQAGSYRLTSNLVVPNERTSAIEVRAANVQIDLNGFTIRGPGVLNPANPQVTGFGVSSIIFDTSGNPILVSPHVSVSNGFINGMGAGGVLLSSNSEAKSLRVHENFRTGIDIAASQGRSLISDNVLSNNGFGSVDILAGNGVLIRGNVASRNIFAFCPSVLIGNVAGNIFTSGGICVRSQNSPEP